MSCIHVCPGESKIQTERTVHKHWILFFAYTYNSLSLAHLFPLSELPFIPHLLAPFHSALHQYWNISAGEVYPCVPGQMMDNSGLGCYFLKLPTMSQYLSCLKVEEVSSLQCWKVSNVSGGALFIFSCLVIHPSEGQSGSTFKAAGRQWWNPPGMTVCISTAGSCKESNIFTGP